MIHSLRVCEDFIVKKDEIKYSHQNVNFVFLNAEPGLVNRIKNNFVALKRAVKLNRKIYHFHDPELIVVGLILKIMFRKKVIYDIHELYRDALLHKNYLPKLFAKVFSIVYILIENISIHFFDYIVLAEEGYVPYYQNKSYVLVQNFIQSKYVLYRRISFYTVHKNRLYHVQMYKSLIESDFLIEKVATKKWFFSEKRITETDNSLEDLFAEESIKKSKRKQDHRTERKKKINPIILQKLEEKMEQLQLWITEKEEQILSLEAEFYDPKIYSNETKVKALNNEIRLLKNENNHLKNNLEKLEEQYLEMMDE